MTKDKDDIPWYDKKWHHRIPIYQNHKVLKANADIFDFVSLYIGKINRSEFARPDGYDILFTAEDGVTKLSHEILEWDAKIGVIKANVKIPKLTHDKDTLIFLYYGNPESKNQQDRAGLWLDYSLAPNNEMMPYSLFKHVQRIIQDLMGKSWFSKPLNTIKNHSAYKINSTCNAII